MSDAPSPGKEPNSVSPELVKRVEIFMGDRPPSEADSVKTPLPSDVALRINTTKTPKDIDLNAIVEPAPEPAPVEPPAPIETEQSSAKRSVKLDDEATERAVDEIAIADSDAVLSTLNTKTFEPAKAPKPKRSFSFKAVLKSRWTWVIVACLAAIIFIIPATRYTILGLFIHKTVTISVVDSKTHTPVSGAKVTLHNTLGTTDSGGKVKLKVPIGSQSLTVTKQYFKTHSGTYFVGLMRSKTPPMVELVATGRQVPITVLDKISHRPISGAEITILDTTAKTNSQGQATIVLPTTHDTESAAISVSGYNLLNVSVTVTSTATTDNTFYMVPAGKIYFLSNQSGKIDVVKTNLDGSARQVVIAGTGKEDPNTTSLLASRDWSYLVLKAQRDTAQPALYLIDTSNDKITTFDSGDANFTLIGWYNHNFMYDIVKNTVPAWTNGHEVIKSYNADQGQPNQLDQSQGEGSSTAYAYQTFLNYFIVDSTLVYNTQWSSYSGGTAYDLSSKTNSIRIVSPSGSGKKDVQTLAATNFGYFQAALYEPKSAYYSAYNSTDSTSTYYNYTNQAVSQITSINQSTFNKPYPTYLLSPDGTHTFWSVYTDGKNTLNVGDANAKNSKTVGSQTDFTPYGWFTDNYLLVSKNNSELYIMPTTGTSTDIQPQKITNYYKPPTVYNGYGYGYGGI